MKALFAFLVVTALAIVVHVRAPHVALAQRGGDRIEVEASVDAATVELGGTVRYQLRAQVTGASGTSPRGPQPGAIPAGMSVMGTSSSPMRLSMNMNGVPSEVSTLTTVWTLRASKLGTFMLGPATVDVGGQQRAARAVKVTVVAQGKAPRPAPRAPDPTDPFGGFPFFGGPDPFGASPDPLADLFGRDDPRNRPSADKRLALDQPRAPTAFLHAIVDKHRAVVGEQVTLSVYLYSLPEAQLGRAQDVHVPSAPDFTRQPMLNDGNHKNEGRAPVGDRLWDVELVLRDALFPIKAGKLAIGPLTFVLSNRRIGYRESETLAVDVTEPPTAGRPAGYALGDVGDFALSATVNPRRATRGESIGVQVELRGTGNLPKQLPLPTAPGIEWTDAQSTESIAPQREDRIGGTRTFTYVVRVDREGAVDLGAIELPYFDPEKRAYAVARAALGTLEMAKGAGPRDAGTTTADDGTEVVLELPKARTTLEGTTETTWLTERRSWLASVLGAPFGCAAGVVLTRLAKAARDKRRSRSSDPSRVAKEKRAEAEAALTGDDGARAVAAVVRAIEAGVIARTGVNPRGTTGDRLVKELCDAGAPDDAARDLADVLRASEDARFSPGGVSVQTARELWTKAQSAMDELRGA